MVRATISIQRRNVRVDAGQISKPAVVRGVRLVYNRSQVLCPVKNGRLRASGRVRFTSWDFGLRGTIAYTVRYASDVEVGTVPHVIKARRKKALRFEWHGRTVLAKRVRHPGTDGQPFLRRAAEEVAAAEGWRFIRRN